MIKFKNSNWVKTLKLKMLLHLKTQIMARLIDLNFDKDQQLRFL